MAGFRKSHTYFGDFLLEEYILSDLDVGACII